MSFLFLTHSAALAGAELRLIRLVAGLAPDAAVLAMEEGPLVDALRARNLPVDVLPLDGAVRLVRREAGIAGAARLLPRLAKLIPRLAAHRAAHAVTVAFSQKSFVAAALSQSLIRRPLVWGLNDIISGEHFSTSMRRLGVTLANRTVRRVVVNSTATGKAFVAAGGRPDLPLVIHPGIDLQGFRRPSSPEGGVAPGSGSRRLRVGCFGRLAPWKGQEVLLRALMDLPEVEAWIVGAAQFGEAGYARQLEQLAADLDLADRVRFLGHQDGVASLMAACDVVAHTSTAPEPFGQVIVEGLACARPVIATAAGGALEIIEHDVNGLLVPPADVEALATALRRLVLDPVARRRLAAAGARSAGHFSTAAMVAAWSRCLGSLAGSARTTARLQAPGRMSLDAAPDGPGRRAGGP